MFAIRHHRGAVVISTSDDDRGGPQATTVINADQVITTGRNPVLTAQSSAEVFTPVKWQLLPDLLTSMQTECPLQESTGVATAEEDRALQFISGELQTDLQSVNCF